MTTPGSSARLSASILLVGLGAMLGGCSSGSTFQSNYVSPIAATPAPQPSLPAVSGGSVTARRMPLLPPVPGDESSNGLPPVTMSSLLAQDVQ